MEGDGPCCYLEQGDLLIDTCVHHKGSLHFPLNHYHGMTIAFQPQYAEKALKELMPALSIDLHELAEKFCRNGQPYVIRADASIDNIFLRLYRILKKSR